MASPSKRSSRRPGGITTRSGPTLQLHQINPHNKQSLPNTSRRKRPRDDADHSQDMSNLKRTRIRVEIDSRSITQLEKREIRSLVIAPDATSDVLQQRSAKIHAATQKATKARIPLKYAEKVANGVRHELNSLQPSGVDKKDEKRTLRSQEGTRFKSDLSAYFPDYDIIIGNESEETYFLNADTPIILIDSNPPTGKQNQPNFPKTRHSNGHTSRPRIRQFPDALFSDLYQSQRVDFAFLDKHCKVNPRDDPLSDAYYEAAHKKAERLERSIRNSEKGRAQHEKDQVIRLLEGLHGHDWLKVMGVTGITESKKKDYTPAREHFIKGCLSIIEKFRTWRDEEKRRKLEKEKVLAEAEEAGRVRGETSDADPPDYSDIDHAAATQLHQEAIARSTPLASAKVKEKRVKFEPIVPPKEDSEAEFRSFYSKRHQREAAIGKHRRSGRLIIAWGQPVPELQEQDFELPRGFRDKDILEANARRKRRDRRVGKE